MTMTAVYKKPNPIDDYLSVLKDSYPTVTVEVPADKCLDITQYLVQDHAAYLTGPTVAVQPPRLIWNGPATTHLDYQGALDVLEKAIAERGEDYVYPARRHANGGQSCLYWHSDERRPGCLVGLALHQLGVSEEALVSFGPANINSLASMMPNVGGVTLSPEARILLTWVQYHQDRGTPWGQALRRAIEKTAETITREATSWLPTNA